jgi:hypothetical protein
MNSVTVAKCAARQIPAAGPIRSDAKKKGCFFLKPLLKRGFSGHRTFESEDEFRLCPVVDKGEA